MSTSDRRRFQDRVVMITAAGRGQGRAHAVRFAREGAEVVLCDLAGEDVEQVPYALAGADDLAESRRLVEECGRRAITCAVDVRSADQLHAAVGTALAEFGRLDVLVANAGIAGTSSIVDMTNEQWQNIVDVNLGGVFKSMRAVLPHMIARDLVASSPPRRSSAARALRASGTTWRRSGASSGS